MISARCVHEGLAARDLRTGYASLKHCVIEWFICTPQLSKRSRPHHNRIPTESAKVELDARRIFYTFRNKVTNSNLKLLL